MAYASSDLSLVTQAIAGPRRWALRNADAAATVNTANYISDALAKGMKKGDVVEHYDTNLNVVTILYANADPTSSGIDLTDGTAITSTDTD